jgi:secondary thiamine-phosphate synthase enzyme
MVFRKHIRLQTGGHGNLVDLTDSITRVVEQSEIRTGLTNAFVVGSTAGLGTIEFEPGLTKDLAESFDRLLPASPAYAHELAWHDGNAHSHLQATLLGPAVTIPVEGGCLVLGTWQQVVLLECDTRPRERTVVVTVMGD